jgi:asparagine synthase (glutamine-hydrolysing)
MDRLIWHQDEPFATTSIYAQWCVFEAAGRAGVTVMLDGQGADEQLFGYHQFQRAFLTGLAQSGHWARLWVESRAARNRVSKAMSSYLRAVGDVFLPARLQRQFRAWRKNQRPPVWLDRDGLGAQYPGPLASRFRQYSTANGLSRELLEGGHLQMLLHWEDRNSMAHSIEARVPFLDYRLVEFILGLPETMKIDQGRKKAVLRDGMQGIVPEKILARRDKMGFVTPESIWARGPAREQFRESLADTVAALPGIITPKALHAFDEVAAGRADYGSEFWRMIALGRWIRQFGLKL